MNELYMVDWLMNSAGRFPTKSTDNYSDGSSAVCDQFDCEKSRIPLGQMHCDHVNHVVKR